MRLGRSLTTAGVVTGQASVSVHVTYSVSGIMVIAGHFKTCVPRVKKTYLLRKAQGVWGCMKQTHSLEEVDQEGHNGGGTVTTAG